MKLEEAQNVLKDILYTVDDICRQENISYSLWGGTMIGAVRHHGFIPWDDDVDIFIWDKDYPAFKAAMEKHLPEYYSLSEPADMDPYFYDFVYRINDLRYHLHTPTKEDDMMGNRSNHIDVDVLLINKSPNNPILRSLLILKLKVLYGLAAGHRIVQGGTTKKTLIQKAELGLLSAIGKHIPLAKISKWFQETTTKYADSDSSCCNVFNDIPSSIGLTYKTEWFSSTVPLKFEERMLPVFAGYHEILTAAYGDYMQPPKDKSKYISHLNTEEASK